MTAATYAGLEPSPVAKAEFIAEIGRALDEGRGYAAGKIGNSERSVLLHQLVLAWDDDPLHVTAFEVMLAHRMSRSGGIFPPTPEFLRRFSEAFGHGVARLDCIGLFRPDWRQNEEFLRSLRYSGRTINFRDQEPDRSAPADESQCYLPLFRGKRLLIVCPFAGLLRDRATRTTFEAVWSKTGKPWFEPEDVEAIEIPYGYSRSTWERYPTALDLLDDVRSEMSKSEADVVLIAAGTLANLIAVAGKEQGKLAISLGGHLQILFGVKGRRWETRETWHEKYFNESWIDMPERYKPGAGESDENYW